MQQVRLTPFIFTLCFSMPVLGQPGVFLVGVPEPSMQTLLVGDTVEAAWQGIDTYAFDPDDDGDVDLLLRSRHYVGGLGSGRSLEVQCSDSTTLATGTAVDLVDVVLGGPVTVEVPQRFGYGELTSGEELYTTPFYFNDYEYQTLPDAVGADLHAWNAVEDGFLVFKKVVQGIAYYGWIRLDTYGPQSSFAVVKEVGSQALATGFTEPVTRGPVLMRTSEGLLVDGEAGSILLIMDAAGRLIHSSLVNATGPTIVGLPELADGVHCALLRGVQGSRSLRFLAVRE